VSLDESDLLLQTRRRPAGASTFVQQVLLLLAERSAGMERHEIDAALRDGWLATDVYRRYERRRTPKTPPYDSAEFKERARHVYATAKLHSMVRAGYARLDQGRYFLGPRVPRVAVTCSVQRHLVPFDARARDVHRQQNDGFVRREQVKSDLLQVLNDPKASNKQLRQAVQLAFEHLSGR
jgi:hypothetical protein